MKIVTLCENRLEPCFDLKASHGLSLFIEYNNNSFLYDVGQDDTCVQNADIMGIDLNKCSKLIISHGHLDHAGGLAYLKDRFTVNNIIIHKKAFEKRVRINDDKEMDIGISEIVKNENGKDITKDFMLEDGVWVLVNTPISLDYKSSEKGLYIKEKNGDLKEDLFEDELSMVFETPKGLIVISGCSHRGIINILNHAKQVTGIKTICCFVGGMHLRFMDEEQINQIIFQLKQFNIQQFIVGHCTGNDAIYKLKRLLPQKTQVINNYVGYRYSI